MADKRKPVIFNVENAREKALLEFAQKYIPNWSGWVKKGLASAAKRQGYPLPEPQDDTTPLPVQQQEPSKEHVTTPKQAEK